MICLGRNFIFKSYLCVFSVFSTKVLVIFQVTTLNTLVHRYFFVNLTLVMLFLDVIYMHAQNFMFFCFLFYILANVQKGFLPSQR